MRTGIEFVIRWDRNANGNKLTGMSGNANAKNEYKKTMSRNLEKNISDELSVVHGLRSCVV